MCVEMSWPITAGTSSSPLQSMCRCQCWNSFCHTSFSVIWHTITQINSITCLGPRTSNLFGKVLKRWKMTGCTSIQYALMKGMGHTLIVSRKSKKQFLSSSIVMVLSSRAETPYKFGIGVGSCVNIIPLLPISWYQPYPRHAPLKTHGIQ